MINENKKTNSGKGVLRYFLSVVFGSFATTAVTGVVVVLDAPAWAIVGSLTVGWLGFTILFLKLLGKRKWFTK